MMHTRYDDEIREVEARLAFERKALVHGAEDLTDTAKRMAASPRGLIAAAAVGFLIGAVTRPRRRQSRSDEAALAPKAVGWGGILGGVALALVRAQFGSPLGMGRAAVAYASARRRAREAARTELDGSGVLAAPVADSPYAPYRPPEPRV